MEKEQPKIRQILIETDGEHIWVRKAETSKIELIAICNMIANNITNTGPQITE